MRQEARETPAHPRPRGEAGRGHSTKQLYRRSALIAIGVLLSVAVVDSLVGAFFYRTGTDAQIEIIRARQGRTERAIVILPGYAMDGTVVGKAFAPFVMNGDALVSINYAQRGVNVENIYRKLMEALRRLEPAAVVLYGASMGGMVGADLLAKYQRDSAPFGKVTLVLDTAPATLADIRRPAWLGKATCWYRGGPVSTAMWAAVVARLPNPPEADADPRLVHQAHHAGQWVGTGALATQACFIRRFTLPSAEAELHSVVKRAIYLHGVPSTDDPLVRTGQGYTSWRSIFPSLTEVPVSGREGRWHIPLVERPKETVNAVMSAIN